MTKNSVTYFMDGPLIRICHVNLKTTVSYVLWESLLQNCLYMGFCIVWFYYLVAGNLNFIISIISDTTIKLLWQWDYHFVGFGQSWCCEAVWSHLFWWESLYFARADLWWAFVIHLHKLYGILILIMVIAGLKHI